MAHRQLLVLLVAVFACYATAQTCTAPDSQLYVFPYSSSAGGYVNQPMAQLNVNATVRMAYYSNYTWVVTQIPSGLTYTVLSDKMGISITGTPVRAGTYTMNVNLFYYDNAANRLRCSNQPINFNFQCSVPITLTPTEEQGVKGTAYSPANVQFVASGGFGSGYSFSANFANPKNGVNLTSSGALVGTWSAPTSFSFYLNVVDDGNCEATFSYTVTVSCPDINIAPLSGIMPSGVTTNYYNSSLTSSGGLAPYTYFITEVSLPNGLTFANDGTVYGTPAGATTTTFFANVEDVNNCPGSGEFSLEIKCATITLGAINGSTLVDKDYSSTVVASGGSSPYTYSLDGLKRSTLANGQLPPGMSLDGSTGVISGKPTATGSYQFSILATDAKGCTQSKSYTIQVSCDDLAIQDIAVTGVAASSYYASLSTVRGSSPYSYTTADTLAKDLVLSSQGILSGELKQTGIFTFTVTSTDLRSCQATRQFTFNITCPTLILSSLITNNGQASKYYSSYVLPDDGVGPYTLVSVSGLPNGIENDGQNFNFAGTPTEIGLFNVTITAADSNDCMNTFSMPLNITCATFVFSGIDSGATVDRSYSDQFAVTSGFIGATSFVVSNGTLPRGLSLATDGTLSGTPTQKGDFTFTVRATDANGCTGEFDQQLSVDCADSELSVNPSLESGQTGVFYIDSFTASGSSHHPYTYSITPASSVNAQLPYGVQKQVVKPDLRGWTQCYSGTYAAGMGENAMQTILECALTTEAKYMMLACGTSADNFYNMAAGPIGDVFFLEGSGTTTSNGVTWYWLSEDTDHWAWGFADGSVQPAQIQCDDAAGDKRTCWYVDLVGEPRPGYRCGDMTGLDGNEWYRYVYVASEIPTIPLDTVETYSLMSNGTISGLPTISGDLGFIVTATDDAGCSASASGILHIDCGRFYVEDLPGAQVTILYSQSLNISGGSGSYSASITGLPQGLTYNTTANVLSGTPVSHGEYPIVIDITDNINPCNYTVRVTFVVLCPPNNLSDIPPVAQVGTTYLATISYQNMLPPVHFQAETLLPYGLTLYRDGTIEGVPSLPGNYEFFVRLIQDVENGCSDGRWYSISVVCGPIDVSDISNNFILGDSVDESFGSSNGIQQYAYTLGSGQLPDGLTLNIDGSLNGTVTKAGFFRFSVRVTDTYGCVGERRFVVAVTCTNPIALGPLPTSFMAGEQVSMAPVTLGGVDPYSFQLLLGALPRGLVLSTDGGIAGNLTSAGTFVFQLGVTDSQGCVATELYTITVTPQPPVDAPVSTGNTPVSTPVAAPIEPPVAPIQAPVQPPVQAPANSPGAVSGQSSLRSAIATILPVCLIVLISM